MGEYFTYEDLQEVFGITVDLIDSKYILSTDEFGVTLNMSDTNENGLPDFYDVILGTDVDLNPSQGVAIG